MLGSVRKILGNKKVRKAAFEAAKEYGSKAIPLVRTIQAGYAVATYLDMIDSNDAPAVQGVAEKTLGFVPSMQVMGRSFVDSASIFTTFSSAATVAGIGANVVLVYQGIKVLQLIKEQLENMATSLAAQTALLAQRDFPRYVHDMIRERVMQTSRDPDRDHWFFVYHPDNDWYPGFYHIMQEEPIGPEFCGYTNQIDTAFVFMLAARQRIQRNERRAQKKGRTTRPVKLHLIIPAYQPILILEALKIPEEIGDFVMEGRINSNREFVWLNLPEKQRRYTQDIGQFVPKTHGWFTWAMSVMGLAETPPRFDKPRVLGTKQKALECEVKAIDAEEEETQRNDMPLQHQPR